MASKVSLFFLGTSDSIPSIKRNHTSIWLSYEGETILVDCGEGTQRQIRKAKLNPCKITRILITHIHGDHVLGLPGLLQTLTLSGYSKTLYIYGPRGFKNFFELLKKTFSLEINFEIIVKEVSGKFYENENFELIAEKMKHSIPTNAYCFIRKKQRRIDKEKLKKFKIQEGPIMQELKKGKDIVYNGKKFKAKELTYIEKEFKICFVLDTALNEKIQNFVKGADVLVSEANFSSELEELAKEHFHLTAAQISKIAKKAKAKKLILTHISQRYEANPKIILEDAKKYFKDVILAKDFDNFEFK